MEEVVYRRDLNILHLDAADIARRGIPGNILPSDFPDDIYITIDVDCFDPSVMPSTGTPEPGGLTWYQMLDVLSKICRERRVVGLMWWNWPPLSVFTPLTLLSPGSFIN